MYSYLILLAPGSYQTNTYAVRVCFSLVLLITFSETFPVRCGFLDRPSQLTDVVLGKDKWKIHSSKLLKSSGTSPCRSKRSLEKQYHLTQNRCLSTIRSFNCAFKLRLGSDPAVFVVLSVEKSVPNHVQTFELHSQHLITTPQARFTHFILHRQWTSQSLGPASLLAVNTMLRHSLIRDERASTALLFHGSVSVSGKMRM